MGASALNFGRDRFGSALPNNKIRDANVSREPAYSHRQPFGTDRNRFAVLRSLPSTSNSEKIGNRGIRIRHAACALRIPAHTLPSEQSHPRRPRRLLFRKHDRTTGPPIPTSGSPHPYSHRDRKGMLDPSCAPLSDTTRRKIGQRCRRYRSRKQAFRSDRYHKKRTGRPPHRQTPRPYPYRNPRVRPRRESATGPSESAGTS